MALKLERGKSSKKSTQWYYIPFLHQCLLAQASRTSAFAGALLLGPILGWKRGEGEKNINYHQENYNNVATYLLSHCCLLSWAARKPLGFWTCIVGPMKIGKKVEEKRTLVIAKQIQQCCHTTILTLPHMALVLQCLLPALGGIQCLEKKGKEDKNGIQPVRHCKAH